MVSTRARTVEIPSTPKREAMAPADATPPQSCPAAAARLSMEKEGTIDASMDYERCREQRIRENRERMQKMGILDLAHKFKSSVSKSAPTFKRPQSQRSTPSPLQSSKDLPRRRSSRLQNTTPISYSEAEMKTKERSTSKRNTIRYEEGAKEEVYTDEHLALLGDCESSWNLFVDGYDSNGHRIYDPVRGKTCHQCRQKTLGFRTECSNCSLVQGQFCGDCLYMRYGENVLEAIKNPEWICPVCRGICNCSLCRVKRGWAPTGIMYKRIVRLGFKSVAHYLIHTRREGREEDEGVTSAPQMSAQRALAFPDEEDKSQIGDSSVEKTSKRKQKAEESTEERESGRNCSPDKRKEKTEESAEERERGRNCSPDEKTPGRKGQMKTGRIEETPLSPDSIVWRLRSRVGASA